MSATIPLTNSMPGTSTAGATTSGVMTRQDPSTGKSRHIDSVIVKPTIRLLIDSYGSVKHECYINDILYL